MHLNLNEKSVAASNDAAFLIHYKGSKAGETAAC